MMRLLTLSIVAGLFACELPAQAEKKSEPTEQAAEIARLRQQVKKLTAENKELKAQSERAPAGTIGRLLAIDRREAAPIREFKVVELDVKPRVVERIELKGVDRMVVGRFALRGLDGGGFAWGEAVQVASGEPYVKSLAKLDAARNKLRQPRDDDEALRVVDEISKALMDVRAELWKRKDAAPKKAADEKKKEGK